MKVAYWPGCVSRGFTPELHGSMAKVAPLLDIELVALDRAACRALVERRFSAVHMAEGYEAVYARIAAGAEKGREAAGRGARALAVLAEP